MLNKSRYREIEEIQNNNGIIVYKAFDLNYDRYVVYKTLDTYSNHKAEELILREYKNISTFDDDCLVRLIEFKQDAQLALITEFIEGETLSEIIQRNQLQLKEKVEIAKKIIRSLSVIHSYNLIHKDINPSNIIWDSILRKATIIDFNLSIRSNSQKVAFSQPKHLQGTLPYVSPEQTGRMNRTVDYRSDIYSLGVTLYELFSAHKPFEQEDYLSLIHAHLAVKPITLIDKLEFFPKALSDIVDKMLSKNVSQRYQSLDGILYDLENYESENFMIGALDHHNTLILPGKVYGRDKEINELELYWKAAVNGSKKLVLVSGESGVGKTTFIKEIYHRVSIDNGYFLSGKFTKISQDSYHVIRNIILEFINVLMMESKEYIENWKKSFNRTNVSVLISLVPELALVLDDDTYTYSENVEEAKNRFIAALIQFFRSISSKEHPVVIFLDDLQWMDYTSRVIFEEILSREEVDHILLIGAYRDEELKKSHTLKLFIDKINNYHSIHISSLEVEIINEMLKDSFGYCEDEISDLLMRKSGGNPFYIKQLLHEMYEQKCIYFDEFWHYDLTCIKKIGVSGNIAQLLKEKMLSYNLSQQQILFASACIGFEFDTRVLANVLVISEDELMNQLNFFEQEDMIVSLSRYIYVYTHDQIHLAAYGLGDIVPVHIKIAKFLFQKQIKDASTIARHLSVAMKQGIKPDFPDLKEVLIEAAEQCMNQMMYKKAIFYYEYMLQELYVKYSKKIVILNNLVKLYYQIGDFDKLDKVVILAKKTVESPYDLVEVYTLEINSYLDRQMQEKGVQATIQTLHDFGIKLSLDVTLDDYKKAMSNLMAKLSHRSIESLLYLPVMANKSKIKKMALLTGMIPLLFNLAPQILLLVIIQMIEISIDYGNCPHSAFGYGFFGTIISGSMGMIDEGISYGQLALNLIKRLKAPYEIPKVNMVVGQHIMYLSTHFNESLELLEEGYNLGVEYGDYAYAGYAGHAYCNLSFIAGRQLPKLRDRFEIYTSALLQMNQGNVCLFQYIYQEAINKLIDSNEDLVFRDLFDEIKQVPEMERSYHATGLLVYHYCKMYLAYIFKDYALAFSHIESLGKYLEGGTGLIHVYLYYEYMALIRLKLFGNDLESLKIVDSCIEKLTPLKTSINFKHRLLILLAEKKAVIGDETAIHDYEDALKAAVDYRYINDEAIYRERISEYYLSLEHYELSSYYLNTAYKAYSRWGALAKAKELIHSEGFKTNVTTINGSLSSDMSSHLDMQSILKLNEFIAKEINLESLMKNTLYVLLENAGATKAVLMSFDNKTRVASIDTDFDYKMSFEEDNVFLPSKVINYVLKSKKIIRLGQASSDDAFMNDDYLVKNNIQSLLVYPLIVQNEVNGIVILENDMIEEAFSQERTEFLAILSSQIAISLRNAIHYSQLEGLISERTKDLIEKNKELEQLNQKLKHMSVTDGLTGLMNRRSLDESLLNEYDRYIRYKENFSVLIIDVDRFKLVNDVYGHLVGDRVLKRIANALINITRAVDIVGRWGGEEFLVICPNTEYNEAVEVAEKIRSYISKIKFMEVGQVTCSIGVSSVSEHMAIKDLVKDADDKLYQSKANGRNKVT